MRRDDEFLAHLKGFGQLAIRSRYTFSEKVYSGALGLLQAESGEEPDAKLLEHVVIFVKNAVLKAKKDEKDDDDSAAPTTEPTDEPDAEDMTEGIKARLKTPQLIMMGIPEIDHITSEVVRIYKGVRDNEFKCKATPPKKLPDKTPAKVAITQKGSGKKEWVPAKINLPKSSTWNDAGIDSIFGRMRVGDYISERDAFVQVAHAFTVHQDFCEGDEFTAVDDLETGTGAAHMNVSDLSSGLFYKYLVLDIGGIRGLIESKTDSQKFLKALVEVFTYLTTVAPMGAKRGSTAPYARASLLLVEVGSACPASMAAAFERPVDAGERGMFMSACEDLARYLEDRDANYPSQKNRYFLMALGGSANPMVKAVGQEKSMNVDAVADAAVAALEG